VEEMTALQVAQTGARADPEASITCAEQCADAAWQRLSRRRRPPAELHAIEADESIGRRDPDVPVSRLSEGERSFDEPVLRAPGVVPELGDVSVRIQRPGCSGQNPRGAERRCCRAVPRTRSDLHYRTVPAAARPRHAQNLQRRTYSFQ